MIKVQDLKHFYEVQEILDKRVSSKGLQYLIKWKGFSQKETTWQPKSHLAHLKKDIQDFERGYRKKQKLSKKNHTIRLKNQKKIQEFLNKKSQQPSIAQNTMTQMTHIPQKTKGDKTVISLEEINNDLDKKFKIKKDGELIELSSKQTKVLFSTELSLFYQQQVKIILEKRFQ